MRADSERFPRVELGDAGLGPGAFSRPGTPVLSVFSPELRAADRRAFETLTGHLAAIGAAQSDGGPLVMIRVENETGPLGASRDHSTPAEAAWAGQVPAALTACDHPGADSQDIPAVRNLLARPPGRQSVTGPGSSHGDVGIAASLDHQGA